MYEFFVTLHARPKNLQAGSPWSHGGREYPTLNVPIAELAGGFNLSFEDAAAALDSLPRMFIEPDGSFVWVSAQADPRWQIDGVLYDRDERLLFVDLKGSCTPEELNRLLSCFGWPATQVIFQLTREAVFLDEATFREWAVRA